jgi:PIN domain nuclease of toxin-antitoxin system
MGKFNVNIPFKNLILKELEENNLQILPIELHHVFALNDLPPIHKDPFDRLLIAQSNFEGLTLVTKDKKINSYSVSILW